MHSVDRLSSLHTTTRSPGSLGLSLVIEARHLRAVVVAIDPMGALSRDSPSTARAIDNLARQSSVGDAALSRSLASSVAAPSRLRCHLIAVNGVAVPCNFEWYARARVHPSRGVSAATLRRAFHSLGDSIGSEQAAGIIATICAAANGGDVPLHRDPCTIPFVHFAALVREKLSECVRRLLEDAGRPLVLEFGAFTAPTTPGYAGSPPPSAPLRPPPARPSPNGGDEQSVVWEAEVQWKSPVLHIAQRRLLWLRASGDVCISAVADGLRVDPARGATVPAGAATFECDLESATAGRFVWRLAEEKEEEEEEEEEEKIHAQTKTHNVVFDSSADRAAFAKAYRAATAPRPPTAEAKADPATLRTLADAAQKLGPQTAAAFAALVRAHEAETARGADEAAEMERAIRTGRRWTDMRKDVARAEADEVDCVARTSSPLLSRMSNLPVWDRRAASSTGEAAALAMRENINAPTFYDEHASASVPFSRINRREKRTKDGTTSLRRGSYFGLSEGSASQRGLGLVRAPPPLMTARVGTAAAAVNLSASPFSTSPLHSSSRRSPSSRSPSSKSPGSRSPSSRSPSSRSQAKSQAVRNVRRPSWSGDTSLSRSFPESSGEHAGRFLTMKERCVPSPRDELTARRSPASKHRSGISERAIRSRKGLYLATPASPQREAPRSDSGSRLRATQGAATASTVRVVHSSGSSLKLQGEVEQLKAVVAVREALLRSLAAALPRDVVRESIEQVAEQVGGTMPTAFSPAAASSSSAFTSPSGKRNVHVNRHGSVTLGGGGGGGPSGVPDDVARVLAPMAPAATTAENVPRRFVYRAAFAWARPLGLRVAPALDAARLGATAARRNGVTIGPLDKSGALAEFVADARVAVGDGVAMVRLVGRSSSSSAAVGADGIALVPFANDAVGWAFDVEPKSRRRLLAEVDWQGYVANDAPRSPLSTLPSTPPAPPQQRAASPIDMLDEFAESVLSEELAMKDGLNYEQILGSASGDTGRGQRSLYEREAATLEKIALANAETELDADANDALEQMIDDVVDSVEYAEEDAEVEVEEGEETEVEEVVDGMAIELLAAIIDQFVSETLSGAEESDSATTPEVEPILSPAVSLAEEARSGIDEPRRSSLGPHMQRLLGAYSASAASDAAASASASASAPVPPVALPEASSLEEAPLAVHVNRHGSIDIGNAVSSQQTEAVAMSPATPVTLSRNEQVAAWRGKLRDAKKRASPSSAGTDAVAIERAPRAPRASETAAWVMESTKHELVEFIQACGDDEFLASLHIKRAEPLSKRALKKRNASKLKGSAIQLIAARRGGESAVPDAMRTPTRRAGGSPATPSTARRAADAALLQLEELKRRAADATARSQSLAE